jgi:hypothetical protein
LRQYNENVRRISGFPGYSLPSTPFRRAQQRSPRKLGLDADKRRGLLVRWDTKMGRPASTRPASCPDTRIRDMVSRILVSMDTGGAGVADRAVHRCKEEENNNPRAFHLPC